MCVSNTFDDVRPHHTTTLLTTHSYLPYENKDPKHTIVTNPFLFHPPHLSNKNTVIIVAHSPVPALLSGGHLMGGWCDPL